MFTTITDPADQRPADLFNRQFTAPAPNRLWVADITFVRTWQGFCYTSIRHRRVHPQDRRMGRLNHKRTEDLPLQAFNHVVWQSHSDLFELVHHSDRGFQYLSLAYTDRLAELGIAPSGGSRGDSYDNALAEAVNAAYKTELINRGKPSRCVATSNWRSPNGWPGTTTNACTKPSATFLQPSTRPPSPAPHTPRASQPPALAPH